MNVLSPRMPLYGTLSLFRTSFAGCYAFPCVSLGCDVSTCKPYAIVSQKALSPYPRYQRVWPRFVLGSWYFYGNLSLNAMQFSEQCRMEYQQNPNRVLAQPSSAFFFQPAQRITFFLSVSRSSCSRWCLFVVCLFVCLFKVGISTDKTVYLKRSYAKGKKKKRKKRRKVKKKRKERRKEEEKEEEK